MTKTLTVTAPAPDVGQDGSSVLENVSALKTWSGKISKTVNAILRGKTNNRGEFTLVDHAYSTTVVDPRVSVESHIYLSPLTSNAAADVVTTYIQEGNKFQGSFIVTHEHKTTTDRKFDYVVIG